MLSAKEIMIKEGWVPGSDIHHNPEEMLAVMNEKYPEQKKEIMMEMIKAIVDDSSMMNTMRMKMLKKAVSAINTLDALNAGYRKLGRSPLINDESAYENAENSNELVAQDMEVGLDLYNACAEYCRIYNAANLEKS